MILDNAGLLSDQQAISSLAAGASVQSDNWIDFGIETERNGITGTFYRDWSAGQPLYLNMLVTSDFSVAGAATGFQILIYGAPNGGTPTYNTSSIVLANSGMISSTVPSS